MSSAKSLEWASKLTPYTGAAAGHEGLSSNASGSLIIKPCTQAEIDFYESAKDHPDFQAHMPTYMGCLTLSPDKVMQAMSNIHQGQPDSIAPVADNGNANAKAGDSKPWIPSGGKQLSTGLAIVLENATTGFTRPNVLDLKLGSRLWDDNAPDAKRQKLDQVAKETTSGSLGFRVAGMKVWIAGSSEEDVLIQEVNAEAKDGYKNFNKMYGRNLNENNVKDAFGRFVGGRIVKDNHADSSPHTRFKKPTAKMLLERLLRELESVQYVLEKEESRMYSASVLVVTEGDQEALETALVEEPKYLQRQQELANEIDDDDDENITHEAADMKEEAEDDDDEGSDEETWPRVLEVRLIDFAHASWVPGQGPDENALQGVKNIIRIVDELIKEEP